MRVTFVSNYINHHQIPLSEELYGVLGDKYRFIQTEQMEEERVRMGWDAGTDGLPYLLKYYEKPEDCRALIADSDVVIFGGTDEEAYITGRLEAGKPVIRYSERLYKEGQWKAVSPRGLCRKYKDHTRYRRQPVYLLCAGAYVPSDFHIVRAYPGKMFRWGYFPPFIEQNIAALMQKKKENKVTRILWSGRFLDWKHPEDAVAAGAWLKQEGIPFELVMVGGGEREAALKAQIAKEGLEDVIHMPGFLQPQEVRREMEQADIFLFTSDYKEGWGAVLNEAMNSGCAVIANVAAGASPYLIEHGRNGFLYRNQDRKRLFELVKYLAQQREVREKLGHSAYETIAGTWNARSASVELLKLCRKLLGDASVILPKQGPCSKAPIIAQRRMYQDSLKKRQN